MDNESFLICSRCGELRTGSEINEDLDNGGSGYCSCAYVMWVWNSNTKEFVPDTTRMYQEYIHIPKEVYIGLKRESNTALRLIMLYSVDLRKYEYLDDTAAADQIKELHRRLDAIEFRFSKNEETSHENDGREWKPYAPGSMPTTDGLTEKQREHHKKIVEDLTGRKFT